MPAEFRGGIYGKTNEPPLIHDSTIAVQYQGKTYHVLGKLAE